MLSWLILDRSTNLHYFELDLKQLILEFISGPLDQILSQVVGEKKLDLVREEKLEDDQLQMAKLKASLSIQAICATNQRS